MIRGSLRGRGEGAVLMPSLCQDSLFGGGMGASKGEGKGHVVKSPLSSSFICSSVFITTTCEGSRFPMYQRERKRESESEKEGERKREWERKRERERGKERERERERGEERERERGTEKGG